MENRGLYTNPVKNFEVPHFLKLLDIKLAQILSVTEQKKNDIIMRFDIQSLLEVQIEGLPMVDKLNFDLVKKKLLQLPWINGDIFLNTHQIIEKNGYPAETHTVTTEDGYILTLHRIPRCKNDNSRPDPPGGPPVIFLQQGVFCSSAVWCMSTREKSLAYRLSDLGYDVWMGNSRGSTYSKGHVCLDKKSKEYWNFSWHEMGLYDLKANFDYILGLTGQPDLNYVGHSQGTTLFFVGMILRPELNAKVRFMTALAPVAFTEHVLSPVYLLCPFLDLLDWLGGCLGIYEILPNNPFMNFLGAIFCHQLSPFQRALSHIVHFLCGYDTDQLNKDILPIMLGHVPAGACHRSLIHYGQGINSGEFRQYNHGREMNEINYGQSLPPDYDLSKVTAPVAIYHANNDLFSTPPDVFRLADLLPNLVLRHRIEAKFNHMDFLWAKNVDTLLYEKVERDILDFETSRYGNNNGCIGSSSSSSSSSSLD